jgi:alpha-1,6-mannosyltransferase
MWSFLVGACFVAGGGLVVLWWRDVLSTTEVLWGAILLRLAFLPLLPELTDDPFRYVWDGWLQLEGINPYRFVPSDPALERFQDAEMYEKLNSQEYYSIYPPLLQLFFCFGALFYDGGWILPYYVLKTAFVVVELVGVAILARLTSPRNLLLYAWNPLVLIETAGQGHTEALLVPLLFAALWAVRRQRGGLASVAIAGAGLVKLYPFALGPFLLRRFGWRAVWPGALVVVGLSIPYAAPYAIPHIKESADLFAQLFEFNAGPYYALKHTLWKWTGADWSKTIGPWFRRLFLVSLPVLYVLDAWRDWSFRRACLLLLGTFLVLSTTVHPWYLLPVVGLGVMGPRPSWHWMWLGLCSVGTYLFYVDGLYWTWIWLGWGGAGLLALGMWGWGQTSRWQVQAREALLRLSS